MPCGISVGPANVPERFPNPASITKGESRYLMIKVRPRPNEPVQQLMRRLKKLCEREGVLREMKRTAYYEKPSDRNRRNLRKAKRRVTKFGVTP